MGKVVATLHEGSLVANRHTFSWDATDMASGKYFVKMESKDYTNSQIITLIK